LGARNTNTKYTTAPEPRGRVGGRAAIDNGKQKEHPFTPKFGISLQASPETLIYGSVSKGFRTGGYNPQVGSPCGPELASIGYPDGRPPLYNADSVWSYELGAKSRLLGGALGIQASVYQIDWNNIQQVVSLNTCGFAFTSNLGSARSRGFDVQASLRVTDHLNLSAEIGYTNPKFRKTIYGGPTAAFPFVSAGDEIANPPWTVSLHGEYSLSWRDYHDTYFRVDYDYRSHQTALTPLLNPNNGAIDPTLANPPATHYLTTRIGHRIGGVDASFFINNLLDKHEWTRRQRDNLYSDIFYSQIVRPRTFGITVSYRY
jgi:outer membrane receptor protein involved in Fe transport